VRFLFQNFNFIAYWIHSLFYIVYALCHILFWKRLRNFINFFVWPWQILFIVVFVIYRLRSIFERRDHRQKTFALNWLILNMSSLFKRRFILFRFLEFNLFRCDCLTCATNCFIIRLIICCFCCFLSLFMIFIVIIKFFFSVWMLN
jgi:hypothetical protein